MTRNYSSLAKLALWAGSLIVASCLGYSQGARVAQASVATQLQQQGRTLESMNASLVRLTRAPTARSMSTTAVACVHESPVPTVQASTAPPVTEVVSADSLAAARAYEQGQRLLAQARSTASWGAEEARALRSLLGVLSTEQQHELQRELASGINDGSIAPQNYESWP